MNEEKSLNQEIAELLGWTDFSYSVVRDEGWKVDALHGWTRDRQYFLRVPDFENDLNATWQYLPKPGYTLVVYDTGLGDIIGRIVDMIGQPYDDYTSYTAWVEHDERSAATAAAKAFKKMLEEKRNQDGD